MNTQRFTPNMLSKFRNGLNSWISLWHFLVHLENLDFYEGLDELNECEIQQTREAYQGSHLCAAIAKRSHHGLSDTPRAAPSRRPLDREDKAEPRSGVRFSYNIVRGNARASC